jgi:hypothetical protein
MRLLENMHVNVNINALRSFSHGVTAVNADLITVASITRIRHQELWLRRGALLSVPRSHVRHPLWTDGPADATDAPALSRTVSSFRSTSPQASTHLFGHPAAHTDASPSPATLA